MLAYISGYLNWGKSKKHTVYSNSGPMAFVLPDIKSSILVYFLAYYFRNYLAKQLKKTTLYVDIDFDYKKC